MTEGTPRGRPGALGGALQEERRGYPGPGTAGHGPLRSGTGPGQPGRRLLFGPGSRAAGPGGAEAPFRPAGGTRLARRLCPAPREQQRRPLRSGRGHPKPTLCGAAGRMLRPSAAARGAAAERGRGGAPAAQPALNWATWRGGHGARLEDGGVGRDSREAEEAQNAWIGAPRGWTRLLGRGGEKGKGEGPREGCGRSRGGKLRLVRRGGGLEQKKRRNNEEKKQYEHWL